MESMTRRLESKGFCSVYCRSTNFVSWRYCSAYFLFWWHSLRWPCGVSGVAPPHRSWLHFFVLFVAAEVSTRSIDLFLVSKKWAMEYHSAASPAIQQLIAGRIQLWEESVGAFYFVLLAGHLLASLCFAIATWDDYRWNRIVAVAFALNALRLTSRVAEGYLGQSWLDPVNNAVYFPAVALIFGTLTAWLWKQTRMVRNEQEARRTV